MSPWDKIYTLSSTDDTRTFYDDWAKSYDKGVLDESQDYVGPAIAAATLLKHLGSTTIDKSFEILDAGCGTGLVGTNLTKAGARIVDGVDLSPGMLEVARDTGVYRKLDVADLSRPLSAKDQSYDAVLCIGTLTEAHVGPEAIDEFVRVVKRGGFVVATVLGKIWEPNGYEARVKSLAEQGKVKLVSAELEDYRRTAGLQARMVVLQSL